MGCCSFFFFLFQSGLVSRSGCFSTSLRKHPFLLALRRWERFARENVTFFRAKRFSACSAEVRSQQSLSKFLHNEQMVAVHKSNPPRTCVYEQYGFTTFLCYEMKLCFLVTLTRSVKRDFWKNMHEVMSSSPGKLKPFGPLWNASEEGACGGVGFRTPFTYNSVRQFLIQCTRRITVNKIGRSKFTFVAWSNKNELWKTVSLLTSFQKPHLQSVSIFCCLALLCLLLHVLCYYRGLAEGWHRS